MTTNSNSGLLKISEIMSILRSVVKNKQTKMSHTLITPIMRMDDSPSFYFNTYTFFKSKLFADNKAFDRSVSDCYVTNLRRPAQAQAKWIIVQSLLKRSSDE